MYICVHKIKFYTENIQTMTLQNSCTNVESVEEEQISILAKNLLSEARKNIQWWVFLLNCFMSMIGTVGGPLMIRFYYQHGGTRKWIATWVQSSGFPILFIPLGILYYRNNNRLISKTKPESSTAFFAGKKLMLCSASIGLIQGLDSFMFATGLAYLPLSTATILYATQLSFTAIFAFILVRQKFTGFSINAVVLMTLGSTLLAFGKGADRPANVSQAHYLIGFFVTLAASAILGLTLPLAELSYAKGGGQTRITFTIVTQFQFGIGLFATIFSTIGMLINHDFQALPREAKEFGLGEDKYYVILFLAAIAFQFMAIGSLGLAFCASSLFAGVLTSTTIPVTAVIATIVFKEKFTGVKGMSLAICLWGVFSYFFGEHKMTKNIKRNQSVNMKTLDLASRTESDSYNSV